MKIPLKGLVVFFVGAVLFSPLNAEDAMQEVVVRAGDTLWGIANFYLKDPQRWPDILKHNKQLSSDPTVALPGMRLRIPVMLIKERLRAAELIDLLKEVRARRKDSNEWQTAQLNMKLYMDDGVRTLTESAARIRFPTGEIVRMNENSLVIIRPEKEQDAVQLLAGDVRANQARVITAGGARIDPLGKNSDFRTRVRPDKTELVLVYRGKVDVTAQGKTVRLPEGFGSEIRPLMPPSEPIPLPKIPLITDMEAPDLKLKEVSVRTLKESRGAVLSVQVPDIRDTAPEMKAASPSGLKAQALSQRQIIQKYRVQISRDALFESPVFDKSFSLSEKLPLRQPGLADGRYFWRIAFVDSLGMESPFSEPRPFEVDRTPPVLTLLSPPEGEQVAWDKDFIAVAGQAEPGAVVVVEEKAASLDADGRFSAEVYLKEGKNRIALRARDADGNTTALERVVYRLPQGRDTAAAAAQKQDPSEEPAKKNFFASVGVGLLTIGTILGIVLLIVS